MIEGIEQDTLEDPPLLFREYVGAPVELKRIMDSQFKLVKTWARYKAKEAGILGEINFSVE